MLNNKNIYSSPRLSNREHSTISIYFQLAFHADGSRPGNCFIHERDWLDGLLQRPLAAEIANRQTPTLLSKSFFN